LREKNEGNEETKMMEFLKLSMQQREQAFRATATRKEIDPFMIEKDFWVVLVLEMLFSKSKLGKHFAFKGGTSLSKAYHLIRRFSEDIDLIIDWRVLGYDVGEPWIERSKNQQNKFNLEADGRAKDYISQVVIPELNTIASAYEVEGLEFAINEFDEMTIDVSYPRIFANAYSLQTIRLEIGSLAAWSPSSAKEIQAYVLEEFPNLVENAMISIPTLWVITITTIINNKLILSITCFTFCFFPFSSSFNTN
jgi:hypothetical protein